MSEAVCDEIPPPFVSPEQVKSKIPWLPCAKELGDIALASAIFLGIVYAVLTFFFAKWIVIDAEHARQALGMLLIMYCPQAGSNIIDHVKAKAR